MHSTLCGLSVGKQVVEHGFHEYVNHTDVLRSRRRLGDVDDIVEFGFFIGPRPVGAKHSDNNLSVKP